MEKIKSKFYCERHRTIMDIEDCTLCRYYDECERPEKHYAGAYIRRILLVAFLITIIILGGIILC